MDFVLVFPLMLFFPSSGHTYTEGREQPHDKCYEMCPAGYYKIGVCNNPPAKNRCKQCDVDTFTAHENNLTYCLRCQTCQHLEVEIKPCNFTSNRECACKKGLYDSGSNGFRNCVSCNLYNCENCEPKCGSCQREECQNDCKKKCSVSTHPPPTTTTILSNKTENPAVSPVNMNFIPWLIPFVVVVVFMVAFLLLLLFTMRSPEKPSSILCWSTNEGAEECGDDLNADQQSHQGSYPSTLTFHISEETPMMPLNHSPVVPQQPAPTRHPLPNAEPGARKQDKQPEHLPAVVLYAIIKEVPLRRWKEFLRLLSVADQQLDRVELETGLGLGSVEKQYQMLKLWSQHPTASLNDVFSVLDYMDLSGCAQLLQENLEKLAWRPDSSEVSQPAEKTQ